MKNKLLGRHEGFTLLEVIVTLVVASILGAMLISMTGGLLARSTQPAVQTAEVHLMNQVADGIARAYRELGSTSSLQSEITSGTFNSSKITVEASATGYGSSGTPVEGASSDLLKVTITGSSGLTYTLLFGNIEI